MKQKKLAVLFPGIGYHKDKPLLYYGTKIAQSRGYEIRDIKYSKMPRKIKGDKVMMEKAAQIACSDTEEQLRGIGLSEYEDVVFISKSIGTIASAKYVSEQNINIKQVWYTPLEATFLFGGENIIAFIGEEDPWSDVGVIKSKAVELNIPIFSYDKANHSLECDDVMLNLRNLQDVMKKTENILT